MKHFNQNLIELLEKEPKERIEFILKELWIGYSKSQQIFDKLDFLLEHPRVNRMPNLLIVGDTNNGKTVLSKRFVSKNKPYTINDGTQLTAPVIYVQAPPVPDEKRFFNAILESTFTPYRLNDKLDKRQQQVIHVLRQLEVKVLIIDEIHHILGGSLSKRVSFLNVIKYLSNELKVSIVAVGIKDAFHAISTDAQLTNRFEPVLLPRWKYDKEYLKLLASFEYMTPLRRPSNLVSDKIAKLIMTLGEGFIGEFSTIIKRSAVAAIKSGEERITPELIRSLDFVPPSERRYNKQLLET